MKVKGNPQERSFSVFVSCCCQLLCLAAFPMYFLLCNNRRDVSCFAIHALTVSVALNFVKRLRAGS